MLKGLVYTDGDDLSLTKNEVDIRVLGVYH